LRFKRIAAMWRNFARALGAEPIHRDRSS